MGKGKKRSRGLLLEFSTYFTLQFAYSLVMIVNAFEVNVERYDEGMCGEKLSTQAR
jgi:hypothetical protein